MGCAADGPQRSGDCLAGAWIVGVGEVGAERGDGGASSSPAQDVVGDLPVASQPVELGQQRLRAVVLGAVAEVDDDQAGVLDAGVAGGDGPVLGGLGWGGRAGLVDAGLQARVCLLKQPGVLACQGQRWLADGVCEPVLDPVGLVEQPLQRAKLVLLLLGVVAALADQQGPARGKRRGDVHAQIHRADRRVAFEHDRLRGVFQQPGGVEGVGARSPGGKANSPAALAPAAR